MPAVTKSISILYNVKPMKIYKKRKTHRIVLQTAAYRAITILAFSATLYLIFMDYRSASSIISARLKSNEVKEGTTPSPPPKASKEERIEWFRKQLPELQILNSTSESQRFHGRVLELFNNNCSTQFFMVWLSPAMSFGARELLAIDTLFSTNPDACLVILSNTLDSPKGYNILKPLLDQGFNILAATPDIPFLVQNTPAESWLKRLKSGNMDPGSIPLYMNLSDLTRLAVLYKYGGIYLDTDIIFLNNLRGLKNAISAQSVDRVTGRWTRLNNAVMAFDINHPLMFQFLDTISQSFHQMPSIQ